ncbi:MAG: hypothetical protein F6K41_38205, partial [Symploca sp. SIO3E6]|nr:hypothetical protein [Caldora sp. SIO3E6]
LQFELKNAEDYDLYLIDSLIGDFDQGTRNSRLANVGLLPRTPKIEFAPNVRAVNTAQLAAMSITYRAVGD